MSATSAINPKGRLLTRGATALGWADSYLTSTVGQKIIVGLTGAGLLLFVIAHMVGNLKLFNGRDSINAYAYFLKHDIGALLWLARGGLLAIFVLHIYLALRLKLKSVAARPVGYAVQRYAQANPAATTMVWTGLVVGAFTLFHLAHYTFGWVHDVETAGGMRMNYLDLPPDEYGRHDVYNMMISGFSTWWIAVIYLLAQVLLSVHLSHGIPSAFQTLGLKSRRFARSIQVLGLATAAVILVGNCAIVLAVWIGYLRYENFPAK
jgi:succinate dehydrogenase / fumarate reductase cytochrome b subunit